MKKIFQSIVFSCYPIYLISMIILTPVYIVLFGIIAFFEEFEFKNLKYSEYRQMKNRGMKKMKCPDCKSTQISKVIAYDKKKQVMTVECRACKTKYMHSDIYGTDIKK